VDIAPVISMKHSKWKAGAREAEEYIVAVKSAAHWHSIVWMSNRLFTSHVASHLFITSSLEKPETEVAEQCINSIDSCGRRSERCLGAPPTDGWDSRISNKYKIVI